MVTNTLWNDKLHPSVMAAAAKNPSLFVVVVVAQCCATRSDQIKSLNED
jgi:hypothetical protein